MAKACCHLAEKGGSCSEAGFALRILHDLEQPGLRRLSQLAPGRVLGEVVRLGVVTGLQLCPFEHLRDRGCKPEVEVLLRDDGLDHGLQAAADPGSAMTFDLDGREHAGVGDESAGGRCGDSPQLGGRSCHGSRSLQSLSGLSSRLGRPRARRGTVGCGRHRRSRDWGPSDRRLTFHRRRRERRGRRHRSVGRRRRGLVDWRGFWSGGWRRCLQVCHRGAGGIDELAHLLLHLWRGSHRRRRCLRGR